MLEAASKWQSRMPSALICTAWSGVRRRPAVAGHKSRLSMAAASDYEEPAAEAFPDLPPSSSAEAARAPHTTAAHSAGEPLQAPLLAFVKHACIVLTGESQHACASAPLLS